MIPFRLAVRARCAAVLCVLGGAGTMTAAASETTAAASETTAIVRVRVVAPDPLPASASVEVRALDSTLSWTAAVSDSDREAVFHHLPPGTYKVTVRLPGFREAAADVPLRMATTTQVLVDLRPIDGTSGETSVQIASAEPLGAARLFDRPTLESFPGDDPLASVVETAVAPLIVDRMSNGGLWLGEAALVGGYGTSWRQTTVALGDLDVTDPVRIGTPLVRPAQEAIDSLLVSTVMLPASAAGPGPVLTLVPTAPARVGHGGAEIGVIANALQSTNAQPGAPSIARFARQHDWNGQAGGPAGSRAAFFLSARRIASDRLERNDPTTRRTSVGSLFANTTVSTGSTSRVRVAGSVDRTAMPYPGRARFQHREIDETDTLATVQASWDRWTDGGAAWSASSGLAQGVFSPALDAVGPSDPLAAAGTVERLLDGPVPVLFQGLPGTRRRWAARLDVSHAVARLGSRHLLQAGATVARNTAVTSAGPSPSVAELVNGIPARIWEYAHAGPDTHWASTELTAYISDSLTLADRVRVNAGMRVEAARGSARGAGNRISWLSSAPRVSGRWLVANRGGVALFGGAARYVHRLPLDYFAYGDPAAATGRVYRWNDVDADRLPGSGERGVLIAGVGPCCTVAGPSRIDPNLQRPHTDEFVAGIESRIGAWSVKLTAVKRLERHLVASVNTGVTSADYVLRYIPDPGEPFRDPPEERLLEVYDRQPSSFGRDQYVLGNPPDHSGSYDGIDVAIEGAIATRLRTRFDGSLYHGFATGGSRGFRAVESDPGMIGELFENPNARTYANGHLFFDRAYVIKWWGSYLGPKDYVVSAVARYQDGQPFSRVSVVPDLNQGPEAIHAYRVGRTRFTFTLSVDLHVEKTMRLGKARVAGVLEVFNLLNTSNEVEEDAVTGPSFRNPTAVQPPRAARIGLRVAL